MIDGNNGTMQKNASVKLAQKNSIGTNYIKVKIDNL